MRCAIAASVALLAGCASFNPPSDEVLARVAKLPPPPGPCVRVRGKVEARLVGSSETVQAVLIARTDGEPAVRLQFLPDLGPKTLDLVVRPGRMVGYLPLLNRGYDGPLRPDHPLSMMAVSLLEYYAPLSYAPLGWNRVLGEKTEDGGWWLRLRPVVEGVDVTVWMSPAGRIERKRIEWGGATLDILIEPDGAHFKSRNADMRVWIQEERALPFLDPALFELTLPPDTQPIEIPR